MPLPQYFYEEDFKQLIPELLYHKILNKGNINASDENGFGAFFHVITSRSDASKKYVKDMLETMDQPGGITSFSISDNIWHMPILHWAIYAGKAELLQEMGYKLQEKFPYLITQSDYKNNNAIHYAVQENYGCLFALCKGLDSKILKELFEQENFVGLTPLDIAILNENLQAILLLKKTLSLTDQEIRNRSVALRNRAKHYKELNQKILENKMIAYLELQIKKNKRLTPTLVSKEIAHSMKIPQDHESDTKKNADEEALESQDCPLINSGGQCRAFSALWGNYIDLDKQDVFSAIQNAIAEYDGKEIGLKKSLPDLLKRKYLYLGQGDLFKQYTSRGKWFADLFNRRGEETFDNHTISEFIAIFNKFIFEKTKLYSKLREEILKIKKELGIESLSEDELNSFLKKQLQDKDNSNYSKLQTHIPAIFQAIP